MYVRMDGVKTQIEKDSIFLWYGQTDNSNQMNGLPLRQQWLIQSLGFNDYVVCALNMEYVLEATKVPCT